MWMLGAYFFLKQLPSASWASHFFFVIWFHLVSLVTKDDLMMDLPSLRGLSVLFVRVLRAVLEMLVGV